MTVDKLIQIDKLHGLADEAFVKDLRRQMLKFATLQLRDEHLAEDVVQEALAGAFKNIGRFAGQSAFKTWVFGILKYKISDVFRQRQRLQKAGSMELSEDKAIDSELFNHKGFWQNSERPASWQEPDAVMQDKHFWQVFEACLEHLPPDQGRVFMMREFIELESHEICGSLEITYSNLNVLLHRARLRLRRCLEKNWFNSEEAAC